MFTQEVITRSYVASGDLSGYQGRVVDQVAAFKIGHSLAFGGIGILQNGPQSGEHGTVAVRGIAKGRAGIAVTAGDRIASAASGWLVPMTLNSFQVASGSVLANRTCLGRAQTGCASGGVFSIELDPTPLQVASV